MALHQVHYFGVDLGSLGTPGECAGGTVFTAGEGRRFYGRTTTSAIANKYAMTIRQPLGVAGLIIAAKSVFRFSEIKGRPFAEYFLIGTLSSVALAALGGLLLKGLLAVC